MSSAWTGNEMLIWGGYNSGTGTYYNDTYSYVPERLMYLYVRP